LRPYIVGGQIVWRQWARRTSAADGIPSVRTAQVDAKKRQLRGDWRLCSNGGMTMRAKNELSSGQAALLRKLPSVDELLSQPEVAALSREVDRGHVVEATRRVLDRVRREIAKQNSEAESATEIRELGRLIVEEVRGHLEPSLREVINASGVILHTNLGRAPLCVEAAEEIRRVSTRYSNLEYDVEAGTRGKRDVHTAKLIERLTGAEDAVAVNNCAAAVLVTLAALARGGEVIVSRGELIEIGDGFRIPEIMEQSGAVLREVGTTNRTRIADYENAIGENTRVLLRVHPSNFQVTGFTEKPEVAELIALGKRRGLPVVEDLGSGCLVDLAGVGINEPTAKQSVEAGFSLVLFSGDKLLGGPQAGIIAGKKEFVAKVRRHPLFRALRVDKLTIAAMEATLRAYYRAAWDDIPALRMIRATAEEIAQRSERLLKAMQASVIAADAEISLADSTSLVGGGSTPAQSLPTKVLRVASARHSATQLEKRLRRPEKGVPVIARIEDERLVIDLRTVFPDQENSLADTLATALQ
jgi:L-seryl-tRNA(Ser) seleniumtransferase